MATPYDSLLEWANQQFGQSGLTPSPPGFAPNWINNITRLNATNMNSIFSTIKTYIDTIVANSYNTTGQLIAAVIELSAGWKTSPTDTGEIFNDYENNEANGNYSHSEGTGSIAGSKAFSITSTQVSGDNTTATLTLAAVENSQVSQLAAGDLVTLVYENYIVLNGYTISQVNADSVVINISTGFNNSPLMLFVYDKSTIGDTSIGIGAHAEGQSSALGDYSHSEGSSIAGGKFSHAEGNQTQALYNNSSSSGYKTKTSRLNQSVVGELNKGLPNTLFEVGNGTEQDSIESRNNALSVYEQGYAEVSSTDAPTDNTLITKKYATDNIYTPLDAAIKEEAAEREEADNLLYIEIEKLRQLNEWLGRVTVTAAEYDKENNYAALQTILTNFVKANTDPSRDPRNGDQITVAAADSIDPVPEYPEIWMFVEDDPAAPPSAGTWKFFSSLQQIVDASTTAKGLVQIGANINVTDGLISVPVATASNLGVVQIGENVKVENGVISVDKLQWKIF